MPDLMNVTHRTLIEIRANAETGAAEMHHIVEVPGGQIHTQYDTRLDVVKGISNNCGTIIEALIQEAVDKGIPVRQRELDENQDIISDKTYPETIG